MNRNPRLLHFPSSFFRMSDFIEKSRHRTTSVCEPLEEEAKRRLSRLQRADSLPTSGRLGVDFHEFVKHLERVKSGDIKDLTVALGKLTEQKME